MADNLLSTTRGLLLVFLAIAWITGIFINSILPVPPQICLTLSALLLLLLILLWHTQRPRLLLLLLFCITLGAWRYAQAQPQYDPHSIYPLLCITPAPTLNLRGTVTDEPKLQTRTRTLIITLNAIQNPTSKQWENVDSTIEVVTLFQGPSSDDPYGANLGDRVELQGKLQPPAPISPKNVIASMNFPRIHVSATGGNTLLAFIYHLQNRLAMQIEQALPQPEAALLIGIFLGLRTPALSLLAGSFRVTGTTHLLVSSGTNVTIVSGLIYRSTQYLLPKHTGPFPLTPLRKSWSDWVRTVLLLVGIAFYTVLSGAGPASLRAGVMGGLLVIAPMPGRRYNIYTALAGTAALMSCFDPFILWDVGFQLSFLATLGIVFLTPYLQKLMQPITKLPAGSLFVETTAVTLAAQIATMPIIAIAFQQISLISLIANLLVAPLPGPLMLLGLVITVTGLLFHELSLLCGWLAWPLLWYMKTIIIQCSLLPLSSIHVDNVPASIAWVYYALLTLIIAFLLHRYPLSPTKHHPSLLTPRARKFLSIGTIIFIIIMLCIPLIPPSSTASTTISFFGINVKKANGLDVRGEAIFVHTQDGKTLLIDGGADSTSLAQCLNNKLPPWQRSLDMVILTSPQQDTMAGLQNLLTSYDIGSVFDPGMAHPTTSYARLRRIIRERNLPYFSVAQGITIPLGTTVQLQVLWPPATLHSTGSNDTRDNGLILRLVTPNLHLLLLGSTIESNYALTGLLASVDPNMIKADIVQVLGNATTPIPASLTTVLQLAQPSLVVITSSTQHKKTDQSTSTTHPTLSSALTSIPQIFQTSQMDTPDPQGCSSWTPNE